MCVAVRASVPKQDVLGRETQERVDTVRNGEKGVSRNLVTPVTLRESRGSCLVVAVSQTLVQYRLRLS